MGRRPLVIITVLAFAGLAAGAGARPAAPIVTLSTNALNFGSLRVGAVTPAQYVTLTNTGDANLTLNAIHSQPLTTFPIYSECDNVVAPGASCTISVIFSPTTSGRQPGTLSFFDNAPGSPQKVSLLGTATAPGVALSPLSLSFPTTAVGNTAAPLTSTLTNQGASSVSIAGIVSSLGDFATATTCHASLAPGASCKIRVSFTPSAAGTRAGTITVTDSDSGSPQLLQVNGAASSGTASLSSTSLNFGPQQVGHTSSSQLLTLTNTGATALGVINITASGDYAQSNTCGTSVDPGNSCSITVTFTPSDVQSRAGFINISDTDAGNLQTVTLSGTGRLKLSAVTVTPKVASLTFTQTQQFQAFFDGIPTTAVTWAVDGIVGGNINVGTIDPTGLYTPPKRRGSHTLRATSNVDPSQMAFVPIVITNVGAVFTYHNDNARTGQNVSETVLTTGNVNATQFGKLFSYPVDGTLRGQPLYVANVEIPGDGFHNVIYVADEHDSVYAFDADGRTSAPLWKVSFIDPGNGITTVPVEDVNFDCPAIGTEFGVTGTPVIDPASGRMYVLARTKQISGSTTTYHQQLHMLDIGSGAELSGSPVEVQASVPGTGEGAQQGMVALDPLREDNRPGLLLSNGTVYIAFSSICDVHPYHGWIIAYDAASLRQQYVFNTSPNGGASGIWQSGAGIAGDDQGNVYFETSNGFFDVSEGGSVYGESVMKLTSSLAVADYFAPFNTTAQTEADSDLSSAGPLLLPDQPTATPHLMVATGKDGWVRLLNRDDMGHFRTTDDNQMQQGILVPGNCKDEGSLWGIPAYWQNQLFVWACSDVLRSFRVYQGQLSPAPIVTGTFSSDYPPPIPAISSNGGAQGILWMIYEHNAVTKGPAVLYAFDASNITRELYDSGQSGSRDTAGPAAKGPIPTVINGKVYVATDGELDVYGLLP